MKNSLSVISFLVLLIVLLPSCNKKDTSEAKEDIINDYLPLTVGAKYKYDYSDFHSYIGEGSGQKGECTWKFISKTVDATVVYQVEQTFNGYNFNYNNNTGRKDSSQIENQISTVIFEVLNTGKVTVLFPGPINKVIFERFIRSDKIDTCFILDILINRGCLRKNVGITSISYSTIGNHSSGADYNLIEGPY